MSTKAVKKIEVKEARKVRKFTMPVGINLILLALGICLLIWADKVIWLISVIIGTTFLVCAAYSLIAYLRVQNRSASDYTKLVSAIALAIAGGFLIVQNGFIKEVISIFIGVFLLVESIFRTQDALASQKYNPNYKNSLILSIIGIVCGALCIFGKIVVPDLIVQVLGVMLIIFAFVDTTGSVMVAKSAKKVHAEVVDEQK